MGEIPSFYENIKFILVTIFRFDLADNTYKSVKMLKK